MVFKNLITNCFLFIEGDRVHVPVEKPCKYHLQGGERGCYSAIQKVELLPSATTWVALDGIILCEMNHTKKDRYCRISLICGVSYK